jgi:hypothetical protein
LQAHRRSAGAFSSFVIRHSDFVIPPPAFAGFSATRAADICAAIPV